MDQNTRKVQIDTVCVRPVYTESQDTLYSESECTSNTHARPGQAHHAPDRQDDEHANDGKQDLRGDLPQCGNFTHT